MTGILFKTIGSVGVVVLLATMTARSLSSRLSEVAPSAPKDRSAATANYAVPRAESQPADDDAPFSSVVLRAEQNGQFHAPVTINGARVTMMVDTGATYVALSEEDANRIGIRPLPVDFKGRTHTANGETPVAPVIINEISLGGITVHDVQGVVVPRGKLNGSLLGMSFLSRTKFQFSHDRLVLSR